MGSVEDNLKRLATTFTVRDIMIPVVDLVCATGESEAALISSRYPDFTIIPIRVDGTLGTYFDRHSRHTSRIELQDLISDGTGLLDLIGIFESRQFAFVLGHRQIEGYVHFSDLNHHLVKLTVYMLLEALERFALNALGPSLTNEYLCKELGQPRFQQVEQFYKRAGDAGHSLVNYLNISDLLRLASKAGTIQIEENVIKTMKSARDGAAHVLENLVFKYEDVNSLARVKRECLRILGSA